MYFICQHLYAQVGSHGVYGTQVNYSIQQPSAHQRMMEGNSHGWSTEQLVITSAAAAA